MFCEFCFVFITNPYNVVFKKKEKKLKNDTLKRIIYIIDNYLPFTLFRLRPGVLARIYFELAKLLKMFFVITAICVVVAITHILCYMLGYRHGGEDGKKADKKASRR